MADARAKPDSPQLFVHFKFEFSLCEATLKHHSETHLMQMFKFVSKQMHIETPRAIRYKYCIV